MSADPSSVRRPVGLGWPSAAATSGPQSLGWPDVEPWQGAASVPSDGPRSERPETPTETS
jgi:hypothetical protein